MNRLDERMEIRRRIQIIADVGKPLLASSHLCRPGYFIDEDVAAGYRFFEAILPLADSWEQIRYPVFSRWRHFVLTAEITEMLTRLLRDRVRAGARPFPKQEKAILALNPHLMHSLGLFHDLGRLAIQDMYRSDVVTDMLFARLGIRKDYKPLYHTIDWFFGRPKFVVFEETAISQRILKVADQMGKLNQEGKIVRISWSMAGLEAWAARYMQREPNGWGTDRKFRSIWQDYVQTDRYMLRNLVRWLARYGITEETVATMVEQKLGALQPLIDRYK